MKHIAAILVEICTAGALSIGCSGLSAGREIAPGTGSLEHGNARTTGDRMPTPPDPVLAPVPPPAATGARPLPGAAVQACIDHELARRGLNAFGDVAGTIYPHGPPVPTFSIERYDRVLRRFPDLQTGCKASTPFR